MSDIDMLYKRYGIKESERPSELIVLWCINCGSWYTQEEAFNKDSELVINQNHEGGLTLCSDNHYCRCNGGKTLLVDGHELNINTPAMEWEIKQLKHIKENLVGELSVVEDVLDNAYH